MSKNWKWYVYILELKNGKYYTGMSWNVQERYQQHLEGKGSRYTAKYGVKELVYVEEHEVLETARIREIQVKDYSQKKKRELIRKYKGIH
jgi:putative endonuclease